VTIESGTASFAAWIGMSAKQVAQISGHSTRVGATQDRAAEVQGR
jgi:hypothetical protein